MPNGYITFNGITSTAAGIKAVESYPALDRPRRKFTKMEIPGKTGDIIIFEDAWADYEQEYEIYAGTGATGSAPQKFIDVMSWLHSANGYARLEDTYDTSTYRMAYFVGPTDVENVLNRYGRAKIKFMCKGKRFLKSGETVVTVSTTNTNITNPTAFASAPVIKVTGSGSGTLTVGGTQVTLNTIATGMIIDCERMTVTDASGDVNLNAYMQLGDFPKITAGTSVVQFTGGVTKLEITPNYFVI